MPEKLIISLVNPPIPISHRYAAYMKGEEEYQEYGWGSTPQEAIEDWKLQYGEEE